MKRVISFILSVYAFNLSASELLSTAYGERTLEYVTTLSSQNTQVDLVVFYQPSYASQYGVENIHKRIINYVDVLNNAFLSHGLVGHTIKIKDIVPTTSIPDHLNFADETDDDGNILKDGAGFLFSEVVLNEHRLVNGELVENPEYQEYRVKWDADLVLYVREHRDIDGTTRGLASIGGEVSKILDDYWGDNNTTVAHEVGHNFGLNHEKSSALTGDSYARAWKCSDKKTIMYSSGSEVEIIGHFSDPNLFIDGAPCGHTEEANNALVLKNNFNKVASRGAGISSLGTVSFTSPLFTGNEKEGVNLTLVRDGNTNERASVKVFLEDITTSLGPDYESNFVHVEFAEGSDTSTVNLKFLSDGEIEDAESLRARLMFPYKLESSLDTAIIKLSDSDTLNSINRVSIKSNVFAITEGESASFSIERDSDEFGLFIAIEQVNSDDAATPGTDYSLNFNSVTFKPGESYKEITIHTNNDSKIENRERVVLRLTSDNNRVEFDQQDLDITIDDDDALRSYGQFDISTTATVNAGESLDVRINRSGGLKAINSKLVISSEKLNLENNLNFADYEKSKSLTIKTTPSDSAYTLKLSIENVSVEVNVKAPTKTNLAEKNESGSSGSFNYLTWILLLTLVAARRNMA